MKKFKEFVKQSWSASPIMAIVTVIGLFILGGIFSTLAVIALRMVYLGFKWFRAKFIIVPANQRQASESLGGRISTTATLMSLKVVSAARRLFGGKPSAPSERTAGGGPIKLTGLDGQIVYTQGLLTGGKGNSEVPEPTEPVIYEPQKDNSTPWILFVPILAGIALIGVVILGAKFVITKFKTKANKSRF